jgi:hypothetical protein
MSVGKSTMWLFERSIKAKFGHTAEGIAFGCPGRTAEAITAALGETRGVVKGDTRRECAERPKTGDRSLLLLAFRSRREVHDSIQEGSCISLHAPISFVTDMLMLDSNLTTKDKL